MPKRSFSHTKERSNSEKEITWHVVSLSFLSPNINRDHIALWICDTAYVRKIACFPGDVCCITLTKLYQFTREHYCYFFLHAARTFPYFSALIFLTHDPVTASSLQFFPSSFLHYLDCLDAFSSLSPPAIITLPFGQARRYRAISLSLFLSFSLSSSMWHLFSSFSRLHSSNNHLADSLCFSPFSPWGKMAMLAHLW